MRKSYFFCALVIGLCRCLAADGNGATDLTWDQGVIRIQTAFESSTKDGLTLVLSYTNESKEVVYIEKSGGMSGIYGGLYVYLDSNLKNQKPITNWKVRPDEKLVPFVTRIYKVESAKLNPGETVSLRLPLEKKYPRITDVHPQADIYVLWSRPEAVYMADPAVDGKVQPVAKSKIGGFYKYLAGAKAKEP